MCHFPMGNYHIYQSVHVFCAVSFTHTHTHTHTHTCIHIDTHSHAHNLSLVHIHTRTHIHTHKDTHQKQGIPPSHYQTKNTHRAVNSLPDFQESRGRRRREEVGVGDGWWGGVAGLS